MTKISPSGGDDTKQIQDALVQGATLDFDPGTYKTGAIVLVSGITWNATGATFQNISISNSGTINNVNMNGGTYTGSASRLIELVATNSNFSDMVISAPSGSSSQHGFGLQKGSYGNKCNKITSNHAALADKGVDKGNEWTDCVYNGDSGTIDGFIIKCKNSTFTRCIVNGSKVAGFGFYAKDDTSTTGIEVSGNKFIDCEAHNNGHAGFSLNCPTNGPNSYIHDNSVQAVSTGNGQGGISFTNTASGGKNLNNTFDVIVHDNPGGGVVIKSGCNNNSGYAITYSNAGNDIQIDSSTSGNTVNAFHPTDQPAPKTSGSGVTVTDFSCPGPTNPPFCVAKYCGGIISNLQVSLQINPSSIAVNQNTTFKVVVTGGTSPYSYKWSNLPTNCPGSDTDTISCNPNTKGTFSISVEVTDSSTPPNITSSTGTLIVDKTPSTLKVQLEIQPKSVKVKSKVTMKTHVSGGSKPYSYNYSGLPHPCKTDNKDHIDCHPDQKGTYNITVNVTDSKGNTGSDSHGLDVK